MADGGRESITTSRVRELLAADLFCGAGGTSTGAMRAAEVLGQRIRLTAVNHWPVALETHSAMHPDAEHICADLESVRPREVVPGGRLDLLMASPTCTYHSRARGGRPVNDQQRMDPWHVHRWCTELRVQRLLVENVPEMVAWGPCSLVTGRPIESRKGEYFRAWLQALRNIGFRLDWRVLNCADYGDPTTRQRFFLIGRTDRLPLRWPEPSHAKGGSADLLSTRAPWRSAAECIDWTHPGKSIFARKKPLAPNTLRRILAGAIRYQWPQPYIDALHALLNGRAPELDVQLGADGLTAFIIPVTHHGDQRVHDLGEPFRTITGANRGELGLVMATASGGAARELSEPLPTVTGGGDGGARPHFVTPLLMGVASTAQARSVDEPAPTITTGGASSTHRPGNARPQLLQAVIVSKHGGPGNTARGADQPLYAVDTGGAGSVAQPVMVAQYGTDRGQTDVREPLPTVTTKDRFSLAVPVVVNLSNQSSAPAPRSIHEPLKTITGTRGGDMAVASPVLLRAGHGDSDGRDPGSRVIDPGQPMPACTGSNEFAVAEPIAIENGGEIPFGDSRPSAIAYRIDILYRMLTTRELARAMSFEVDGVAYPFKGTATDITKQIGNAVPVRTAQALVSALLDPAGAVAMGRAA